MSRSITRGAAVVSAALLTAGTALAAAPAALADNPPAPTKPAPVYNGCSNPLPATVLGAPVPAYQAGSKSTPLDGSKTGVTVWHDGKGWHLRATHNQPKIKLSNGREVFPKVQFEGRIVSTRPAAVRGFALENARGHRDAFWVFRPAKKVVGFRFMNYAGIDGLDFTNACSGKTTIQVWKVTTIKVDATTTTIKREAVPVWTGKDRTVYTDAGDATPGDGRTTVVILRTKKV